MTVICLPVIPISTPPEPGQKVICYVDHSINPHTKFIRELLGKKLVYTVSAVCRYIDNEGYPEFCEWVLPSGCPIGVLEDVTHWSPLPILEN